MIFKKSKLKIHQSFTNNLINPLEWGKFTLLVFFLSWIMYIYYLEGRGNGTKTKRTKIKTSFNNKGTKKWAVKAQKKENTRIKTPLKKQKPLQHHKTQAGLER